MMAFPNSSNGYDLNIIILIIICTKSKFTTGKYKKQINNILFKIIINSYKTPNQYRQTRMWMYFLNLFIVFLLSFFFSLRI